MAKRFMPVNKGFQVTSGFGPRWGTEHRGTDYGLVGGSGGHPVYASQGGIVVHAGGASGFGGPDPAGWVVVDHPTGDGSGTTVYGHIIREVSVGQRVEAGQRIGRINPDQNTNGGVAPHLHFEVHPYSWLQGSQINPEPWLSGAAWPGGPSSTPISQKHTSTLFGIDISSHQKNYSLLEVADDGMEYVFLRLCDGTYVDDQFKSHLWDAERTDMLITTYWYLRAPSEGTTIAQQVDVIDMQLEGRKDLGVWIDVESVAEDRVTALLTEADVWEAKRELERRGYYVPGIYSGAWYWEKMPGGEPSMDGLGYLWMSHYGKNNPNGDPRNIYLGDDSYQWDYPLGNRKPDILQFGSNGVVADRPVDVNAFRGTKEELARIFSPSSSPVSKPIQTPPTFLEDLMSDKVKSLINPKRSFDAHYAVALIDRATWENRVLLFNLYKALGLDPQKTIDDAVSAELEKGR